jgi:uncharacterized protein
MTEFTPVQSTIGGILIGIASVAMLALQGRIAGISGIVGGLFSSRPEERSWRLAFLLGLTGGGVAISLVAPDAFGSEATATLPVLALAGILVGLGTRLGSGCTSGHGVCGMSRLSTRSFAATGTFLGVAALTVFVTRHLIG